MWGAVWENFVVSQIRTRLLDTERAPGLWFWRTASGDEVDLLVETGPERFMAFECKTAQQVGRESLRGLDKLAVEYGAEAIERASVVCRTETAYPIANPVEAAFPARAVPVHEAIASVARS